MPAEVVVEADSLAKSYGPLKARDEHVAEVCTL
jgi:hypothetical protein